MEVKEKKLNNSKKCDYSIAKWWKGLNQTESEYFAKKRDDKNKKTAESTKNAETKDAGSDSD